MNSIGNTNNNSTNGVGFNNITEMTLTDLQEMAIRQQKQIEINQQLLLAKEKRLKALKLDEQRNQQLALLSQSGACGNGMFSAANTLENTQKLENLKQNVLGQELKIFKLKQLRNQILEYKLSNSNMYSELDLIKSLFSEKERELVKAISKVTELTKQIDQLRKIKNLTATSTSNKSQQQQPNNGSPISPNGAANFNSNLNVTELEKLKQELQIRNKLNEQQAKKIIQQHEQFNKKQMEVLSLDKRIEELKNRIAIKRSKLSEQMSSNQLLSSSNQRILPDFNSILIDNHHNQQNQEHNNQAFNILKTNKEQISQNDMKQINKSQTDAPQQNSQSQVNSNSPSKTIVPPKYATKQEIANTYMNKYGSDVLQKYRLLQQQQQNSQNNHQPINISPYIAENNIFNNNSNNINHAKQPSNDETESETSTSSSHTNLPSSSSSLASLSPINNTNLTTKQLQQLPAQTPIQTTFTASFNNNGTINTPASILNKKDLSATHAYQHSNRIDTSTLPSHLKLEFDKIKYLPDMVKTIKKRHSISEIEGSSNTLPPQVFQKILEKHHKNFLEQQNNTNSPNFQASSQHPPSSSSLQITTPQKLNKITEEKADFLKSFNSSGSDHLLSCDSSNSPNTTLTSLDSKASQQQQLQQQHQQNQKSNNESNNNTSTFLSSFMPREHQQNLNSMNLQNELLPPEFIECPEVITTTTTQQKSTKSIIKQQHPSSMESVLPNTPNDFHQQHNKRVNFDPHALLLDAAVEGELDLVIKCAKQVKDVSEPNDEGITALHNSVCAGHYDIVKFLVEFGCDINYADNDGWTPLHCAASCNNIQMITFLIENGASVFATTLSDNETAIKKCEEDEEGYQVCFDYLKAAQNNLGDSNCNNATVYALYSYEKENEDELSFQCFEQLIVLDKHEDEEKDEANDGWWTCRSLVDKREGLVPKNYLGVYPRVRHSSKNQESTIC